MRWCTFCDVRGHLTSDCWYKPKHIKEIKRENGKLKKTYTISSSNKRNDVKPTKHESRSKTRTPSPSKQNTRKPTGTKSKQPSNPNKQSSQVGEVEVVEIIKQTSSNQKPSSCKECLKWDMRMQHSLKYQEVTRNEDKKIIKSLTEEVMRLKEEKDCYKKLYEINKK